MYSVLVVQFFTMGFVYLLAPWSFRELGAKDGEFFSGIFTDFNS